MLPVTMFAVLLFTKMGIPSERFFQCLRHILDHADFIFITVSKDYDDVLFKFEFYHAIAKEIINWNGQSIGKAYNRGQTDAGGASFNVTYVFGEILTISAKRSCVGSALIRLMIAL